jgi:uncharacterized protein YceK
MKQLLVLLVLGLLLGGCASQTTDVSGSQQAPPAPVVDETPTQSTDSSSELITTDDADLGEVI